MKEIGILVYLNIISVILIKKMASICKCINIYILLYTFLVKFFIDLSL